MCSFRTLLEVAENVHHTPELQALLGVEAVAALDAAALSGGSAEGRDALRAAFTALMSRDASAIATYTAELSSRLGTLPVVDGSVEPNAVAARLLREFPGDVGVFAPYLLNVS